MIRLSNYLKKRSHRVVFVMAVLVTSFFSVSSILAITMFAVLPQSAQFLIPDISQVSENDRLLVLSPHPDDETIAAGGLIASAINQESQVKVVLVTDGNKHGKRDERYQEFRRATTILGVGEANLEFWGFSDGRGNDEDLAAITNMIVSEIKTYNPTIIISPIVEDSHFDHHRVGQAFLEAVKQSQYQGKKYGFLVHHRYFPQPKEYQPDDYLTPPVKFLALDDGWLKFNLSGDIFDKKSEAVFQYHSQLKTPFLNSLLQSMIRKNEIFVGLN